MHTANHPFSDGSRHHRSRASNARPAAQPGQAPILVDTVASAGLGSGAVRDEHSHSAWAVLYALLWVSAWMAPAHATPNGKTFTVPQWLCALPQNTEATSRTSSLASLTDSDGADSGSQNIIQSRPQAPSLTALPLPTPSRAQFMPPSVLAPTATPGAGRSVEPTTQNTLRASTKTKVQTAKKPLKSSLSAARPKSGAAKSTSYRSAAGITITRNAVVRPRLAQLAPAAPSQLNAGVTVTPEQMIPAHESPVASLPAATIPVSPNTGGSLPTGLPAMQKIITISALKLPPASQPLDPQLRARAISLDGKQLVPTLPRLAQNPAAPAVTQPGRPVTNSDRLSNQIEVAVSTFVVLLTTTDLQTVAVADPNIADVAVINSRSVLVNGKTPGVTSLVVVDRLKIRQYQVRVTPPQGSRTNDITAQIGIPGVNVRQVRESLVLEGEVGSPEEARRAEQIAGAYSTRVINQLVVRDAVGAEAGLAGQIQSTINLPDVRVRLVGDTAFLDGRVENTAQYQRAETVARALSKNVVNLIQLPTVTVEQLRDFMTGGIAVDPNSPGNSGVAAAPTVRQVGDQIILEGSVPNQAQLDQALAAAQRTGLQIVNRLQVAVAPTQAAALLNTIEQAIGRPGVRVRGTAQRLVLEGVVPDTNAAVAAEQIARAFATEVDNMLQTPNPLLVNVEISIVEISRNDAKNLGIQLGSAALLSESITQVPPTFIPGVPGSNGGAPIPPVLLTPGGTSRQITIDPTNRPGQFGLGEDVTGSFRNLDPLRVRLDALYSNGRARLLSNPRTTVLSGRTATFQNGGQVPYPAGSTTNGAGTSTTIEFKDYGILLDVIPIANPDGVVTMRVRAEVSEPDFTNGVTPPGGGSPIPGFLRRSTVTEVTVRPNGTLALSGLVQNSVERNVTRIPILSRIPILGSLFTSKRFQNNETELVIFVRPNVLANILPPGSTAPASPVAVGNTTNVGTTMGNPGITTFNRGESLIGAGGGGGGTGGGR